MTCWTPQALPATPTSTLDQDGLSRGETWGVQGTNKYWSTGNKKGTGVQGTKKNWSTGHKQEGILLSSGPCGKVRFSSNLSAWFNCNGQLPKLCSVAGTGQGCVQLHGIGQESSVELQ